MDGSKVLIFTSTKKTADMLTRYLREDGWPARAIHGDSKITNKQYQSSMFSTLYNFMFNCSFVFFFFHFFFV